uniref:Glycosyltransferase n=1 Tax=viral metagenome TaxID=1070528 RepID=A0A6C0CWL5_9ZZZZ
MKITKHMTFFNTIKLRYRFNYINRIIKEICNYPYETDLYIHTNEMFSRKFLIENTNGKIEIIVHDFSNGNPYYLAWSCRCLLHQQKDDYDIFMYIEDDMLIPRESLQYWFDHKDSVLKDNYNLGFVRIETDVYGNEYLGDLDGKLNHQNTVIIGGKSYVVNNVNTYCASWIYDKSEFRLFLASRYYHGNTNIPKIYGIRTGSAIGMHGFGMDVYKNTIIPYDIESKQLDPGCKIYHLDNVLMYRNENCGSSTIQFKDALE